MTEALKQLRQEDSKFQSSLAYTVELHKVLLNQAPTAKF